MAASSSAVGAAGGTPRAAGGSTRTVAQLPPDCATLLIHGTADEILSPRCSEYAYRLAHEPKRLRLYKGTRHGLDEAADEIRQEVRDWIVERLPAAG